MSEENPDIALVEKLMDAEGEQLETPDLDRLEKVRKAGTQGEWLIDYCYGDAGRPVGLMTQPDYNKFVSILKDGKLSHEDAILVVSAVHNLQPLIDLVRTACGDVDIARYERDNAEKNLATMTKERDDAVAELNKENEIE